MIYQMQIYYGALLNGQVIYSFESSLDNCKKFPKEINEKAYKTTMEQAIINDGLNPTDFEIGFLTKDQYNNRFNKENEISTIWTIEK